MPSLTDTAIRQALKRVEMSGKQENLADGEGRGTGRLVLVLKPMPKRITADWMAQQWRDGKRTKKKIGSYPSMPLAQAREIFKREFADVIQKGRSIKIATRSKLRAQKSRKLEIGNSVFEGCRPISKKGSASPKPGSECAAEMHSSPSAFTRASHAMSMRAGFSPSVVSAVRISSTLAGIVTENSPVSRCALVPLRVGASAPLRSQISR